MHDQRERLGRDPLLVSLRPRRAGILSDPTEEGIFMRKFIAAAAIATAAAATSACGHVDNEDGPRVSRNFAVGNFQQIEVAGPYDVDVRTGANASVSAQGSQKLLDRTIVEVQGDRLVIHPQEHHNFFNFSFGSHGNAHFTVTVPQLTAATITGSGGIKVDRVQGATFEGTVAGSGGLNVDNVDVQSLKLSIGGSGSAKARGGKATSARLFDRRVWRHRSGRRSDAAGEGFDRGLRKHRRQRDRHGRRQHHGIRRCHRRRRR